MPGKFELKLSSNGKHYFNLLSAKGQVLLVSEMYESRAAALNGIDSVRKNAATAARYQRAEAAGGRQYFSLKAGNHQVIGTSPMHPDAAARDAAITAAMSDATEAALVDLSA